MVEFREIDPIKRDSPKTVTKYSQYKKELQSDFYARCGYCNDSDFWCGGRRFYQLDHFVPKKKLVSISITEYTNLVYSCFYCNNSKRAKWPTGDELIHNNGTEGFVNPKEPEYRDHLHRNANGEIISKTDIGKYMVKAMKLNLKRHAIIWNLERIENNFDKIDVERKKLNGKIPSALSQKINDLFFEHREYSKNLRKENDA